MRTVCMFVCLAALWAAAAPGDEHRFELAWEGSGFSEGFGDDLNRTEPFAVEPDTQGRTVYRGAVSVGLEGRQLGFLWDRAEGVLYVDCNLDGDLTNDPNGRLTTQMLDSPSQDFDAFEISVQGEKGMYRYKLRPWLYSDSSYKQATFSVLSGYSGTCELYDRKWTFQACDGLRGKVDDNDVFNLISTSPELSLQNVNIPERLFIGGRCYETRFEFRESKNGVAHLLCILTEREVPMGELLVKGESIQQLVLGDGTRGYMGMPMNVDDSRMLILPEVSKEPVAVPAGEFKVKQIALKPVEDKPVITASALKDITVPEGGQAELAIGGPLKSSVNIDRRGNTLVFSYKLLGCGGEEYSPSQVLDYEHRPTLTVYKGDTQLATGTFEFG